MLGDFKLVDVDLVESTGAIGVIGEIFSDCTMKAQFISRVIYMMLVKLVQELFCYWLIARNDVVVG
jgi:hypothetical protein